MTRKTTILAALFFAALTGSMQAQTLSDGNVRNYFPKTGNVKAVEAQDAVSDSTKTPEKKQQQLDFISRNFQYLSLCDWTPGLRFMVRPSQKDLVIKTFAAAKTGNMVSTKTLENKILVYDGHSSNTGTLHEHMNFHVQGSSEEKYFFEVPTSTFDDYCYGKVGVPALAYLEDVDRAMDSLVGKRVRVRVRSMYQDVSDGGGGIKPVDIGPDRRGSIMTITKVGVGTRNFPVKIIVKEADKDDGREGQEFFQYVTISRTNCGYRSDELEIDDMKLHTFEGSFQLLDDKMAVSDELQEKYLNKQFYTFFDTKMRNSTEQTKTITRLSVFTVTDIYRLGDSNTVMLTLKGRKTGETYTKEVALGDSKVDGSEELLSELFVEGDPEKIEGVNPKNMPFIQKSQVKKGFTEAEVRLTLGEPTDVTRTTADIYQWTYMQKDDRSRPFRVVKFSYKTKKVAQDMTR